MAEHRLDDTDIKIMEILQQKARTKRSQLAEAVGLSIPTVSERLQKLERNGYLDGFYTKLNAKKVNLGLTAFMFLTVDSSKFYDDIIQQASDRPEVLECHAVTGEGSHLLKVRTADTHELELLLATIQAWPGVKNTKTVVVLSSPKESTVLSLEHLKGLR